MRLIQVIGVDQTPGSQESADGLYALNSMLDAWGNERLMVYQIQQTTHSWAASAASRTIGFGGDFSVSRPIKIEHAGNFFRDGTSDFPLITRERQNYDGIADKTGGGSYPSLLYYDGGFPTRTLYAYPVPSLTLTLYLNSWKPLQAFSTLTAALSMPPGYQRAIEYNLAIELAPEFGAAAKKAAEGLRRDAVMAKQSIRSVNQPDLVAQVDMPGIGRPSRIESDG